MGRKKEVDVVKELKKVNETIGVSTKPTSRFVKHSYISALQSNHELSSHFTVNELVKLNFHYGVPLSKHFGNIFKSEGDLILDQQHRITSFESHDGNFKMAGIHRKLVTAIKRNERHRQDDAPPTGPPNTAENQPEPLPEILVMQDNSRPPVDDVKIEIENDPAVVVDEDNSSPRVKVEIEEPELEVKPDIIIRSDVVLYNLGVAVNSLESAALKDLKKSISEAWKPLRLVKIDRIYLTTTVNHNFHLIANTASFHPNPKQDSMNLGYFSRLVYDMFLNMQINEHFHSLDLLWRELGNNKSISMEMVAFFFRAILIHCLRTDQN